MLLRFTPKTDHLMMVALTPVEGVTLSKALVQILPGVNEITDDEWKCIRPNIKTELDKGEITILAQKVSDGRGKPGGRKAKDLVQMPVNIAVSYISECMNPETLTKWYKEETREEVRLHITKKLEKLGIGIPEDEIPEAPNASPMSLDEFEDEDDSIDETDVDDDNTNEDGDAEIDNVDEDDAIDLSALKVEDLKKMAKELEIEGYETMKKAELIEVLSNAE